MMSTATDGSLIGTSSVLRERQSSKQDMVFPAHDGNELVHDAARHSGKFVLGLLAKQRLFDRIEFFAGDGFEQRGGGDFQGGAAGQTAAQRHGRMNQRVEAAGIQCRGRESRR